MKWIIRAMLFFGLLAEEQEHGYVVEHVFPTRIRTKEFEWQ